MSDLKTSVNLLPLTTTNAVQSATYENDYVDSVDITLNIVARLSASLTLTLDGVLSDGTTYNIFTGPAEATTGVKRYSVFPGNVNGTNDKDGKIPSKIKVTVTPTTPGNDQYSVALVVYSI